MFDPRQFNHDETVDKVIKLAASIPTKKVAQAFLYSLTTRDLPYRSALGSFAMSFWMPFHVFTGKRTCEICGDYAPSSDKEDFNVLNFERLKWGGVRHFFPMYQLFDLDEFLKLPEVVAKSEDVEIFRQMLEAISHLPADSRPRDAEKAITPFLKSSKDERNVVIQILGYCGILQPKGRTGFFREYTKPKERAERPVNKIDWNYPVSWWQGSDGVNQDAIDHYFGSSIGGSN